MRLAGLAVISLAVWLLGNPALAGPGEADAKAVLYCEAILKGQLKSPASYRRVNIGAGSDPITDYVQFVRLLEGQAKLTRGLDDTQASKAVHEYAVGDRDAYRTRMTKAIEVGRERWAVVVYDAQNSFGAMLRGKFQCGFLDEKGDGGFSVKDVTQAIKRDR